MVILIGGVGYAGKTLMSQKLLEKYKFSCFSIDHLKMGLYRADINCGFTPLDSTELIGEKLWGIIKGIIMTCIENKQNLILEGCYLLPQKIQELGEEYLSHVISFYLGFSEEYIAKNFQSKVIANMRAIEARDDNTETAEDYITENQKQKNLCEKYNAKYFEIDGEYNNEIEKVYDWIDAELRRKEDKPFS